MFTCARAILDVLVNHCLTYWTLNAIRFVSSTGTSGQTLAG